jgi:hypothetical protein
MDVNLLKTRMMIVRGKQNLPEHLVNVCFTFKGQPLTIVEEEIYLGIMLHSWKDMCYAAEHRATAASKNLHAMLSKCKRKGINQPAFLCRIFDVLVLPVLSYGAHVWGPSMFQEFLRDPLDSKNKLERVHWEFLKLKTGMGKSVHKEALCKEFGRYPIMRQWLVLAARWWNTMAEHTILAYKAFKDDLIVMGQGCSAYWSWLFLDAMTIIKVVTSKDWTPRYGKNWKTSLNCVLMRAW